MNDFGAAAIYDLTDELRPVCYVSGTGRRAADPTSELIEVTPAY
jgi:hypothetical protein